MAPTLSTIASSSNAIAVSKLTTPENLSRTTALLSAITYSLLTFGITNLMLVWSAGLSFWSYYKQLERRTEEEPYVYIHDWLNLLSLLYLITRWMISRKAYCLYRLENSFVGVAFRTMLAKLSYAFDTLGTSMEKYLREVDWEPILRSSMVLVPGLVLSISLRNKRQDLSHVHHQQFPQRHPQHKKHRGGGPRGR